jgi:hypothetical protein
VNSAAPLHDTCTSFAAWEARECLYFLTDEDLSRAIAGTRGVLLSLRAQGREGSFLPNLIEALNADADPFDGEPVEQVAQAMLYLAYHGLPDGLPTAH